VFGFENNGLKQIFENLRSTTTCILPLSFPPPRSATYSCDAIMPWLNRVVAKLEGYQMTWLPTRMVITILVVTMEAEGKQLLSYPTVMMTFQQL
jgi:hypothetical protein